MEFSIEPIDAIQPYESNARNNSAAIPKVAASIKKFGFTAPIVVNLRDRKIIAGHTRHAAAKLLGLTEVPVRWVDLADADARAMRLADNRLGEIATWDADILKLEIAGLKIDDILTAGFSELDYLRAIGLEMEAKERIENDVSSESEVGGVYRLGPHILVCGDCSDESVYSELVANDCQLMLTDPPYGISYLGPQLDRAPIENDSKSGADLIEFLQSTLETGFARLKPATSIVFSASGPASFAFCKVLGEEGLNVWKQTLMWAKSHFVIGRADYHTDHEIAFYCIHDKDRHISGKDRKSSTTIHVPKPHKSPDHPTEKPVRLFEILIANHTLRGHTVGDIFGGSGTTMEACNNLKRNAVMVEISPVYCDAIRRRWARIAAKTGQPLGDGLLDG